jgi:hypothetical protein
MKVTGFTFIRNAIIYDYPVVESIQSILPLCDNFVVAVGKSDDGTRELIEKIDRSKVRIIETIWDDNLREGGKVLALETGKAFQGIEADTDWAFYIQGDEVVHEKYLDNIFKAMTKWKETPNVDGLLFSYLHFYGSYDYVGSSDKWYKNEVRVIRNNRNIYSYKDAQGFRKEDNKKLKVKPSDAWIYHYGWVKHPDIMQKKHERFHRLWHDDHWMTENVYSNKRFDYSNIDALARFTGTHPKMMEKRIQEKNWQFDHDLSMNRVTYKDKAKRILKKYFGIDTYYNNYKLI